MPLTAQYNIYGVTRLITNQLGCNSNVKMTKKRLPNDCGVNETIVVQKL